MTLARWLALAAALVACKKDKPPTEDKRAAHEQRAVAIVGELKELGLNIDVGTLEIEVKKPLAAREDLDEQQDMFFRPSYFAGMQHIHASLGLVMAANPEQFRELAVLGISQTMQAYYQPSRNALVFMENSLDQLVHMDALVAHELGHAIQDARPGGLPGLLAEHNDTLDGSSVVQCLIEGEAEVISAAVLLGRNGRTLDNLSAADFDHGLERVMAGTTSLVYSTGRRFIMGAFHQGGWKAVERAVQNPLASTEQVLHEQKRGDEPTELQLPDPPASAGATLIHEDVLGELNIYALMLELGTPDRNAYLAAAGWDGDRIRIWQLEGGKAAIAWRILWDRDVDAGQFAHTFARGRFSLHTAGRVVDLYIGPPDLREVLLPGIESPPEDPDDATSAAAVEADYSAELAEGPAVVGDRWVHKRFGLSIPIPDGWRNIEFQGVEILAGDAAGGFADNVTVGAMPNINGYDLDGFKKENEDTFGKVDTVELIKNERGKVGGKDVLVFEYDGTLPGATQKLHFVGFLFNHEDQYVIVTITVMAERWKALESTVRDVIARVEIE